MNESGARFVVWDPTGIIDDISCNTEAAATRLREELEATHGWEFRLKKVFTKSYANCVISGGCIPPGTRPTKELRVAALEERARKLEREIRILQDRRDTLVAEAERIKKETPPSPVLEAS